MIKRLILKKKNETLFFLYEPTNLIEYLAYSKWFQWVLNWRLRSGSIVWDILQQDGLTTDWMRQVE